MAAAVVLPSHVTLKQGVELILKAGEDPVFMGELSRAGGVSVADVKSAVGTHKSRVDDQKHYFQSGVLGARYKQAAIDSRWNTHAGPEHAKAIRPRATKALLADAIPWIVQVCTCGLSPRAPCRHAYCDFFRARATFVFIFVVLCLDMSKRMRDPASYGSRPVLTKSQKRTRQMKELLEETTARANDAEDARDALDYELAEQQTRAEEAEERADEAEAKFNETNAKVKRFRKKIIIQNKQLEEEKKARKKAEDRVAKIQKTMKRMLETSDDSSEEEESDE
jgi:hypothetical protein